MSKLKRTILQALSAAREVDVPTYERDRVGEAKRWDERDILFAREALFHRFGPDSPEFKAYYTAHPEHLEEDTAANNMPEVGRTGGVDVPMFATPFAVIEKIGVESCVDGEPAPDRVEIPLKRASVKVKALARFLGAGLAKIGPLRQEWVYSHVGRSRSGMEGYPQWGVPIDLSHHTNAIAMGFQMDYLTTRTAPDFPTLLATAKGYGTGAWVSIQLAEYIRMLGYSARAHHLANYRVLVVPVAVDCGLGELSRAGYLMTREFGLGLRLAVVTTDMPLAHDKPVDLGIQSFCKYCKICAEECPSKSIPMGDKIEYNGIKKWKLNEETCFRYWHTVGTDCSICLASCPWTRPKNWFHETLSWLAMIKGPQQWLMTQADKFFYGRYKSGPGPDFIDPYKRYRR
jgi:ferredoxin